MFVIGMFELRRVDNRIVGPQKRERNRYESRKTNRSTYGSEEGLSCDLTYTKHYAALIRGLSIHLIVEGICYQGQKLVRTRVPRKHIPFPLPEVHSELIQ